MECPDLAKWDVFYLRMMSVGMVGHVPFQCMSAQNENVLRYLDEDAPVHQTDAIL
jgi:hypothetical protein